MESAIFGLVGVVLGAVLATVKDWWFHRRDTLKAREYLTIRAALALENVGLECAEVVRDDGLLHGQYDSDGCRAPQAPTPSFDPQSLDVEWRAIPADLMYLIFNLPNEINAAEQRASLAYDYQAGPPDYEEYFEKRRISYATIGENCFALADRLRKLGNLPKREHHHWDPVAEMLARKREIEDSKQKREARQRNSITTLSISDAKD